MTPEINTPKITKPSATEVRGLGAQGLGAQRFGAQRLVSWGFGSRGLAARVPGPRRPDRGWDRRQAGMATAEYAIATLAATGFAGLLLALLRSGEVRGLLSGIVRRALSVG
jgi:hypothetical protein